MTGFLGYLGEVEASWDSLSEVEETRPKPSKKIKPKKVISKKKKVVNEKVNDSSDDEYKRYLQLKKKFEKEEYLRLKSKYEGVELDEDCLDESVEEVESKSPKTARGHAAFILEGIEEDDVSQHQEVSNDSVEISVNDARMMSNEDLNKLSPKSHASLLL